MAPTASFVKTSVGAAPATLRRAAMYDGGRLEVERRQLGAQDDPLLELAQRRVVQALRQLRLADEDDVDQLGRRRLEVRQEPDLLEQLVREALRLVDDDGGQAAGLVPLEQVALEGQQELRLRPGAAGELEPVGQNLVELRGRERRVAQHGDAVFRAPLREQRRASAAWSCPVPASPSSSVMPSDEVRP